MGQSGDDVVIVPLSTAERSENNKYKSGLFARKKWASNGFSNG